MAKENRRAKAHQKTVLDPRFPIPLGAETEFVHSELETLVDEDMELIEIDAEGFTGDEIDSYIETLLGTPEQVVIVSQKLRRAPGGQNVVDIVIEVSDVPGATDYEIKNA